MGPESNRDVYLLDTSALLTFIEDEEGAEEVERILRTGRILLPFVVLLEVYYITLRGRGEEVAGKRYAFLKSLEAELLWDVSEPLLLTAGKFKGKYKLSLADAIIAAFAKDKGAILVHKDPEYEALGSEIKQLALPYKG